MKNSSMALFRFVGLLVATITGSSLQAATLVHEFFLPMPEAQIRQTFYALESEVNTTVNATFSIVVTGNGTIIYYDQWEDGYEIDLGNKVQATTLVWGDGNNANGIAPGFANDPAGLSAGAVLTLNNNVSLPRNPGTILYDGRDRVAATKALVISRMGYPTSPGSVLADAVEVPATIDYGTQFVSPVGQDIGSSLFQYTALFVMAAQDNTAITLSTNGSSVFTNIVLNRGESYLVNGGIRKGAYVNATKPVQVQIVRGRINANYETDWFTLVPRNDWSSSYYTPVGTAANGNPTYVFVYNPNPTNITISVTNRTGSSSFVVSNAVHRYLMPANSGASFTSQGGAPFFALSVVAAQASSQVYDWGFTLLPSDALTSVAVVGLGLGTSDLSQNGNPVWVTAPKATRIYVDRNGRGDGALSDPFGRKYDVHHDVVAFESLKLYDSTDRNQTAMRVFTADGTPITAAWGQDSAVSGTGNPFLDAGTTVLPFPVPVIRKSSRIIVDNGPAGLNVGDVLEYTVELDNRGLLPLGNLVVIDAPPANISYVPNTTTNILQGVTNAISDDAVGSTVFPLDETGYTIPLILRAGTTRFTYHATVVGAGSINNTVTAEGYNVSAQNVVNAPSGGITPPTVNFTDSVGTPVAAYTAGAGIYVTVTDPYANLNAGAVDSFTISVRNITTGDVETITLVETGPNTGVFRNASALPSSLTAGLLEQDGTVNTAPGNVLSALHVNAYGSTASASSAIAIQTQNKVLYLATNNAANGQVLQRIDPVAASRNNNGQTASFSSGGLTTLPVAVSAVTSGSATGTGVTVSHTTSSGGTNRFMLVSVATSAAGSVTATSVTYNGVALTSVGSVLDTSASTKPRLEIFAYTNPPVGTFNVAVTLSGSADAFVGVTTFTNVHQTTPFTNFFSATPGSAAITLNVGSAANELVFDSVASSSSGALGAGAGQTARWNAQIGSIRVGASTEPGAGTVTASWSSSTGGNNRSVIGAVALRPATIVAGANSLASFVQAPAFAQDFTIPAGSNVRITNYVTVVSGTLPANPDVTATLAHSGSPFLTLSSPVYNSGAGTLVWSGSIGANVTIPAGQTITYGISNGQAGVSYTIDYDRVAKPSKIVLPTTNIIKVASIAVYDAPYPGGTAVSSPVSGSTLYVRAVVTDPFGAYDITSLGLNIDGPGSAGDVSTTLTDSSVVASDSVSKTYQYVWSTGATIGSYTVSGTANEGTEGIIDSAATSLTLNFLDNGTPSTAELTSGNNGPATTTYAANAPICIRVKDIDKNTNGTTIETITAVVSTSSDAETVTLTETGVNTGIFTACVSSSGASGGGNNNGTLLAPAGSVITLTYTDPDDGSDVSTTSATIPAASPSVSVTQTRLTAGTATVGQSVQFLITVANNGNAALPNVSLTETFPAALTYASASAAPNTVGAGTLTWNNVGPLAIGQSTNLTVTFTAASAASPAQTTANVNAGGGVTSTANATVTILNPAALSITKTITSPAGPVNIGDNINFQIVVENTGGIAIPTLPFEDSFSAACFEYVSSSIVPDGVGAGTLFWSDITDAGSLSPGGSIVINVTMKVVGGCDPANNTAKADFAEDANGNPVPASSGSVSRTTIAATVTGGVYDTNSVGIADVAVQLYTDPNNDGDPEDGTIVRVLTTDLNGLYEVPNLQLGNYVLVQTDLPGYASLTPANNRLAVNINDLTASYVDFDFVDYIFNPLDYATINGFVYDDANVNGVKDASEGGVVDVMIELVSDVNGNGLADVGEPTVSATTTSVAGSFSFGNLVPGDYVIVKTDFFGYVATGDSDGANDNQVSVTLVDGQTSSGHTFLTYLAGSGGGNSAPVALADSFSMLEDGVLTVVAAGVLTNDVDINGDTLSVVLVSSPSSGSLTFNSDGSFSYTPDPNFNGSDSFTYRANDGALDSGVATVTITVAAVNDQPSLDVLADLIINEDAVLQTVNLSGIDFGPANEGGQSLTVTASSSNPGLIPNPSVTYSSPDATGNISFTPVANAFGTTTITVTVEDNGGTDHGAQNTRTRTFAVTVNSVNDAPSFVKGADQTLSEDAPAQSVNGWATAIAAGPANEAAQVLTFVVSNDNNGLFSVQPAVASDGTLTYTLAPNAFGTATVSVRLTDSGGTANGGTDGSAIETFTITADSANDAPSFTKGADQTVAEDSGAHTVPGWATAVLAGPANESAQTISFNLSNDNNSLFSVQPAIAADGTLTYTLATDAFGSAIITVSISDNGGIANGGVDTSANQTFVITALPVNDAPSFTKGTDVIINYDDGAQSLLGWATFISAGPANEAAQTVTFLVSNDNNALFSVQPAISDAGTLVFTPSGVLGTATVTIQLQDNGGTANGGEDTSGTQVFTVLVGTAAVTPATGGEAISADSVGGAWTTLTGPVYTEGAPGDAGVGTIILNAPAGFEFDTGGTAPTVLVTRTQGSGADTDNINGVASGSSLAVSAITATQLTLTLTSPSAGDVVNSLTWQNVRVRPTAGTPLANGNLTKTGTSVMAQVVDGVSNFGTLNEVVGAASQMVFVQQPSSTEVNQLIGPAVSVRLQDAYGNNVESSGVPVTLTLSSGTGTLNGTVTVNTDASGIATFSDLSIDQTGSKQVTASSGVLEPELSNVFAIISDANNPPTFTKGPDQTVYENSAPHTVNNWANDINPNDPGQSVWFEVVTDNPALFVVQPAISPSGTLTYTLAPHANGTANITVVLRDDGGTANGGIDASAPQTFAINVLPVNSAPVFTLVTNNVVAVEDGGSLIYNLALEVNAGALDEATQNLSTSVVNDNASLFSVQPHVDVNGVLTYTLAPNANGIANITLTVVDDGGTANGGQNTSVRNFTITVLDVNDQPTFQLLSDIIPVRPLTREQVISNYVQSLLVGPADEAWQNLVFTVTNNNPAAFTVPPTIDSEGTLRFEFAPGTNGVATVGVVAQDNGGTDNGGVDTSIVHLFRIGLYTRFAAPTNTISGSDATAIAVGDFVKDGVLDIASASYADGTITTLRGLMRTFVAVATNNAGPTPIWVRESEFNSDGMEDLVVANHTANTVSVLLNEGSGFFSDPIPYVVGINPVHIGLADFNGDGRTDLAVANNGENTVSILLGIGGGAFSPAMPLTVGDNPSHVFLRDINRDGNIDMSVANTGDNTVGIYFGVGNGAFTFVRNIVVGNEPKSAVLADLNKDNLLDLTVANSADDNVTVYLGDGAGNFTVVGTPASVGDEPRFIAEVRDVNTDGTNDVIVANYGSGTVSVLIGHGNGTFAPAEDYAVGNNPTVVLSRQMFSEDNRTDIIVANSGSPYVTVLRDSAPLAYDRDFGVGEDGSYLIDLRRFSGSGSGPLTYTIITPPANGTLVGVLPLVTYVPNPNFQGRDTFVYEVSDGILSARAEVAIRVWRSNDPATFVLTTNIVYSIEDAPTQRYTNFLTNLSGGPPNESQTVTFRITSSDKTFFTTMPAISPAGLLTYRTKAGRHGTNTITIVAAYGGNPYPNPQTETFQIVVTPSRTKPLQGLYNGLYYETNGVTHESSGFFTLRLKAQGAFTGKTLIAGKAHSFSGLMNDDGQATFTIARTNGPNLLFNLLLDVSNPVGAISGTVSCGTWTADLLGDRVLYHSVTNPAPQAGKYTMIIPGQPGSTVVPAGDGFASVTVDNAGRARLSGMLADGTAMSQSVQISTAGHWPVYVPLYRGVGSMIGWLNFTNSSAGDLAGTVGWVKTGRYSNYYPNGFTNETAIVGSTYVPPASGVRVLDLSIGVLTLRDGLLDGPISSPFRLGADNVFVVGGEVPFNMVMQASSGRIAGSFRHPVTNRSTPVKGVVLQQQDMVRGYFMSTNSSGGILLQ